MIGISMRSDRPYLTGPPTRNTSRRKNCSFSPLFSLSPFPSHERKMIEKFSNGRHGHPLRTNPLLALPLFSFPPWPAERGRHLAHQHRPTWIRCVPFSPFFSLFPLTTSRTLPTPVGCGPKPLARAGFFFFSFPPLLTGAVMFQATRATRRPACVSDADDMRVTDVIAIPLFPPLFFSRIREQSCPLRHRTSPSRRSRLDNEPTR